MLYIFYPPYEGKNLLKRRMPWPIGPLYLAAYLECKGIRSQVVNMSDPPEKHNVETPKQLKGRNVRYWRFGWSDDEIISFIKEKKKHTKGVVGVSSLMSSNYTGAYKLIELLKREKTRETIIGGPHATAYPEHVSKYSKADYICIGEGEEAFYDYLQGDVHEGIIEAENVGTLQCRRQFIKDLDTLPFPRKHLLYGATKETTKKEVYVTFSRGCPHKCSFCGSHLIQGRLWRHKSVERCMEEIDFYSKEWGTRSFVVEDDNPCPGTKGVEFLKQLCEKIIDYDKKLKFHVSHGLPVYAVVDKELSKLLYKSGFRNMVLPVESTDVNVLKDMNKEFTMENFDNAVNQWRKVSNEKVIPVEVIFGYPFKQTIESMLQTIIDVAARGCLVWASHFRLNRGIELFDRCIEAGYVKDKVYDPINTQTYFLETPDFTIEDLKEISRIARGVNYATERGWNVFGSKIKETKEFHDFKLPMNLYCIVVEGRFKFNRSQADCVSVRLMVEHPYKGKPVVKLSADKTCFTYEGIKSSKVYSKLKQLLWR